MHASILYSGLTEFPKEREVLAEYRQLLHSLLLNGLRQWSKDCLLGHITNGEQFARALKMLEEQTIKEKVDSVQHSKFLEDSK